MEIAKSVGKWVLYEWKVEQSGPPGRVVQCWRKTYADLLTEVKERLSVHPSVGEWVWRAD